MIYDCFSFFNELDLLEIRLNILSSVVDKFVLVEADRTFSNEKKPFYFAENKKRYSEFLHKIIHIQITEYPQNAEEAWTINCLQLNTLFNGLVNCNPDDIILLSDLDEIPNPEIIINYKRGGIYTLKQKYFCYYLNYQNIIQRTWDHAKIMRYYDIIHNELKFTNIRSMRTPYIKNGGWHFTYLGGIEKIKAKLNSFVIQETIVKKRIQYLTDDVIEKYMKKGIDLFRPTKARWIPIKIKKGTFPDYIVENQDKYKHLIYQKINHLHNFWVYIAVGCYFLLRPLYSVIKNIVKRPS